MKVIENEPKSEDTRMNIRGIETHASVRNFPLVAVIGLAGLSMTGCTSTNGSDAGASPSDSGAKADATEAAVDSSSSTPDATDSGVIADAAEAGIDSSSSTPDAADSGVIADAAEAGIDSSSNTPDTGAISDAAGAAIDSSSNTLDTGAMSDAAEAGADAGPDSSLANGLVSWWRGEGNGLDSIGQNNGTLQGGVTFVAGKMGQAFAFDGTTADVLIATSTTLNVAAAYTIAFWINVPAWPSQPTLVINKWVFGAEDKAIYINPTGTIGFYLFDVTPVANVLVSVTKVGPNSWHHVAATYNGSDENIYIDGNFDASQVTAGNVSNSVGSLAFGHNTARAAYNNTFFAGDLDEIRWYSRALSAAEIAALASGSN